MKKTKAPQQHEELQEKLDEVQQKYLRAQADYHNLEARTAKHVEDHAGRIKARLLMKIIDLIDDMEQAAPFITDPGLQLILTKAQNILSEESVEELDVKDKPFDPYTAECLELVDGPTADIVAEVIQKGYKMNEKVIRPAKVKVTRHN